MKVKICGLTNKEDAVWALNYGADYLGINFYKESPRHNSLATASKWIGELPSFASTVGIFVNSMVEEIVEAVQKLKLKGVQLHGDETAEFVGQLREALEGTPQPVFIIKAMRVTSEADLENLAPYAGLVDFFLLDAFVADQPGGTGVTFDWAIAAKAREIGKPIFLAGGLNSGNVKEAVKKAGPFAVDVSSGVEKDKTPRKKDFDKMRDFIQNAKGR